MVGGKYSLPWSHSIAVNSAIAGAAMITLYYLANPPDIIRIWVGGMSFHGGALGVILALALLARVKGRPFLQLGDFLVPTIPLGLAAGRIGNFINGELWGREAPEGLPWAMIFPTGGAVARHPSQIYQALLEGVLLFVILWLYARAPRLRGQVAWTLPAQARSAATVRMRVIMEPPFWAAGPVRRL